MARKTTEPAGILTDDATRRHRRKVIVWCQIATLASLTGTLKWCLAPPATPSATSNPSGNHASAPIPFVITGEGAGFVIKDTPAPGAVTLEAYAAAHQLDPLTVRALITQGRITPAPVARRLYEETYLIAPHATITPPQTPAETPTNPQQK